MAPERPLLADLRTEAAQFGAELRQMFQLRWQLAQIELESDARAVRRLAICLGTAGVMSLTALPLLVASGAELLARYTTLSTTAWLGILGGALLVLALLLGTLAWCRFRRELVALEETREELREDLVWLREWTQRPAAAEQEKKQPAAQ